MLAEPAPAGEAPLALVAAEQAGAQQVAARQVAALVHLVAHGRGQRGKALAAHRASGPVLSRRRVLSAAVCCLFAGRRFASGILGLI